MGVCVVREASDSGGHRSGVRTAAQTTRSRPITIFGMLSSQARGALAHVVEVGRQGGMMCGRGRGRGGLGWRPR